MVYCSHVGNRTAFPNREQIVCLPVKVVGKRLLVEFCDAHADAVAGISAWLREVEAASWRTTHDIRARYPSASFVQRHVIFNVRGNRYRLDVIVSYSTQVVSIIRVGTHAEYNRWSFSD